MSKKRCKSSESRSLRAAIEQQLAAAAEEIFRLLKERRLTDVEQLKELLTERITAAVEQIFTVFEATRAAERGPEEPGETPERSGYSPDTNCNNTVGRSDRSLFIQSEHLTSHQSQQVIDPSRDSSSKDRTM